MEFETLAQHRLDLVADHPYVTGAVLATVAVLGYFKLKLVLKAIIACLILGAVAYLLLFIINLTSTGIESTEKLRGHPNDMIDDLR